MARIGFAYNQKPDPTPDVGSGGAGAELPAGDEEPPSPLDDVYAEWDAPATISAVARALAPLGEVIRLEATDDFPERLRRTRPDIVFNIAEGLRGPNREAHVPAICEFYGIPYSGSDPFTLSLCLDKARTKELLGARGVATAAFRVVCNEADLDLLLSRLAAGDAGLALPLFVKPLHEGSSRGITARSLCRTRDALAATTRALLAAYAQPALVESWLPGAEFTCGILGNGATARALPLVGVNFDALPPGAPPLYGYEAKWVWDTRERPLDIFACPAPVSSALAERVTRTALDAYHALGCRDWSRVDLRLDETGAPMVIEVNPLPGILPDPADNSCLPKAARAAGLEYDALIQACLLAAAERTDVRLAAPSLPGDASEGNPLAAIAAGFH